MDNETLALLLRSIWALDDSVSAQVQRYLGQWLVNPPLAIEGAPAHAGRVSPPRAAGNVAVLPLRGMITPRATLLGRIFGHASLDVFTDSLNQAAADSGISAIVLDVASPGGLTDGVTEAATRVAEVARIKPVVAVANSLAASAAYWIAAAASELVVSPSAEIGSIGVMMMHQDWSKALETEGVKVSLVKAGRFKGEVNSFSPLSDEARAVMQVRVDGLYAMFVRDVAAGRKVTQTAVREGFGEGRTVGAAQAVKLGMADRVATLDATVTALRGKAQRSAPGPRAFEYTPHARRRLAFGAPLPTT